MGNSSRLLIASDSHGTKHQEPSLQEQVANSQHITLAALGWIRITFCPQESYTEPSLHTRKGMCLCQSNHHTTGPGKCVSILCSMNGQLLHNLKSPWKVQHLLLFPFPPFLASALPLVVERTPCPATVNSVHTSGGFSLLSPASCHVAVTSLGPSAVSSVTGRFPHQVLASQQALA